MRPVALVLLLAGVTLSAACTESAVLGPEDRATGVAADPASSAVAQLGIVTRNMYVGADLDAVIAALRSPDPADDFPALIGAIQTLVHNDFPARAAAMADEIARANPHAVGLQEVSQIDLVLPSQGINIHQDFLAILQAELLERGLDYDVAAQVRNIEAAPPLGILGHSISLVDFDVLLVKHGIPVLSHSAQNFSPAAQVGVVAPGVELKRGWVTATVRIGGAELVLVSTHLESGDVPGFDLLRAAQISEILAPSKLDPTKPAVLIGDLNDDPGSPMYQVVTGAGFVDLWRAMRPGVIGFTCCHSPDLSNHLPDLDQRLDYVLARGLGRPHAGVIGKIERLGEVPGNRIQGAAGPIWPSDHAGLAAELH